MASGSVDDTAVLDAPFTGSPRGLFVLDADWRVTRCNPSGLGVQDPPAGEIPGHRVEDFAPGFEPGRFQALIDEFLATGGPLRGRLLRGPSPSRPDRALAVEVSLLPLPGPGDGSRGAVGVVEDATGRQAAADRLAVPGTVHAAVGTSLDTGTTAGEPVRALAPGFADAARGAAAPASS